MRFVRSIFSGVEFWFSFVDRLSVNDYRNRFKNKSGKSIFFLTPCKSKKNEHMFIWRSSLRNAKHRLLRDGIQSGLSMSGQVSCTLGKTGADVNRKASGRVEPDK